MKAFGHPAVCETLAPELVRRFKIVAFDWDGTAVMSRHEDAAPVRELLETLLHFGVLIVVITGTNFPNIDRQLSAAVQGPHKRRLYISTNRGSEVYGFDEQARPVLLCRRTATTRENRLLTEIADAVRSAFPEGPLEALTYLGQNFLVVPSERILPVAMFLKSELGFDMLADLTAVDYPKREKRFEVIYELYSFPRNERLRLKAPLGDGETIESVVSVWGVADWLERECFDMFGIRFANHPNLKRILLPDEWEGYPLRKDYGILQQDAKWVRENLHIESGQ